MRISVTGANGFLGKEIVKLLKDEGHHVIAYVREVIPNVECRVFDLTRAQNIDFGGSEAVIHCAAYLPSNYEDISEATKCLMINGIATLELLQAAEQQGLKKFVHFSSGQIYGWKSPTSEAFETEKIDPVERASAYLISKLVGDLYVRSHKGKLNTVVLRPSYIYGPGMRPKGLLQRIYNAVQSGQVDMSKIGSYNVDLVYVTDVAEMAILCATKDIFGVYNVGGGRTISTFGLVRYLASMMGKDISTLPTPLELDRCHPTLNIDEALSIGYEPTKLDEGLLAYVESLK